MKYQGDFVYGGALLYVPHENEWVEWRVSNWSGGTQQIFGSREGGELEQTPAGARWIKPKPVYVASKMTKAERAAHLAARDQCVADIRARDKAAGLMAIDSGNAPST